MGPRQTCVPIIIRSSTPDGLRIRVAGSGKSILWFVISRLWSPVTVLMLIASAAIIQHIMKLRDAGEATLAYFYFDFGDEEKQNVRNVTTSLIIQLSEYSKPCRDLVYHLYLTHGNGLQQPSNDILINRLKDMLTVTAHRPIFIIMDALDECPDDFGWSSPREAVLDLLEDLVRLHLPNLHVCVTSRPEIDIRNVLEPLTNYRVSLHDESGQYMGIANYVSSVVSSDVYKNLKWRCEDKELVVKVLSERADGM